MDLVEVKGISKRKQRPRVLQVKDAWQILDALVQPFRTIVLIGLCFGLRISEILGLRWTDFDFKRSVVLVQRSAVGKRLNKLKTEYSQDEVPIERGFILELRKWQALCLDSEENECHHSWRHLRAFCCERSKSGSNSSAYARRNCAREACADPPLMSGTIISSSVVNPLSSTV